MSKRRQTKPLPPDVSTTRIYTDGSAFTGTRQGGWGVYIALGDGEEKFLKGRAEDTTISRMEMLAMSKALDRCLQFNKGTEVNIYSDSAMVVNSINKGWLNNWARQNFIGRINSDLWIPILERLRQLKIKGVGIVIHHINGHLKDTSNMHIFGNSVADILCDYKT